MKQYDIDLQSAINLVGQMCVQATERFISDKEQLPSWGPDINSQVQTYIEGLQDWIIGTLTWSFETERYFGKVGGEVRKTRVVELQPRQK